MHRNITFMFDYWTDPGVHLLLLKSSMGNNACNSCRSERAFGTVEEEMPSVVLLKILLLTNYLIFANIFVLEGCLDFCLEKVFDRTFKAQKSATKLQLLKILSYIVNFRYTYGEENIFCKYLCLRRQFRCFCLRQVLDRAHKVQKSTRKLQEGKNWASIMLINFLLLNRITKEQVNCSFLSLPFFRSVFGIISFKYGATSESLFQCDQMMD